MTEAREIHLVDYPDGMPTAELFNETVVTLPEPGPGEVLLKILWMSVDPYMRGRMNPNVKSYIPAFKTGEALDGGAVGQVLKSNDASLSEGDYVVGFNGGWRDHYVGPASAFNKVDPNIAPLSAFLGVLGMPGITAWGGLTQILEPKEGQTLYVSGAAGAVGSLVCQLGKHKGMQVLGSAGTAEKCAWLEEKAGVDKAFNYKEHDAASLTKALAEAAPKGINAYFENVGGMQLEAVLNTLAERGRIALCGMISQYNNRDSAPGVANIINLIPRTAMMRGFLATEFMPLMNEFFAEVGPLVMSGKIVFEETQYEGLSSAPGAFLGLFSGDNLGKAVIKVA